MDPSQLFHPIFSPAPSPVERSRLPEIAMSFGNLSENIDFTLVGGRKDKIVGVDSMGRGVLYDDHLHAVAPLPNTTAPKHWPTVSILVVHGVGVGVGAKDEDSVGAKDEDSLGTEVKGSVYVIETVPQVDRDGRRSVEALVYEGYGRWAGRPLLPPPYVHDPGYGGDRSGEITCYAANFNREGDGALIWVSTAGRGTYWLDTVTGEWTKAGD
jgi:hypothetical protein